MSPEIEIFGAYIPGWLIASILGIVLAAFSKIFLSRIDLHRSLPFPILFYPCLSFLWAAAIWLVCFN